MTASAPEPERRAPVQTPAPVTQRTAPQVARSGPAAAPRRTPALNPKAATALNGRDASHGCRGSSWRRPRTIGARFRSSHSSPLSPPSTGACSPWRDCCSHSSRSAAVSCFRSPGASYRRVWREAPSPGSAGPTGAGVRSVRRSSGTVRTHPDVLAWPRSVPELAHRERQHLLASRAGIHPDRLRLSSGDPRHRDRTAFVQRLVRPRRCVREDDHHPPRRHPSASDGSDAVPPA